MSTIADSLGAKVGKAEHVEICQHNQHCSGMDDAGSHKSAGICQEEYNLEDAEARNSISHVNGQKSTLYGFQMSLVSLTPVVYNSLGQLLLCQITSKANDNYLNFKILKSCIYVGKLFLTCAARKCV